MNLEEKKKFIINFLYLTAWITIIYLLFKVAAAYLFPFLIGTIIAYIVQKPAMLISDKIKIKKQNCAAVLSVVAFVAVIALIILLCWILYSQLNRLIQYFSNNSNEIIGFIEKIYTQIENIMKKTDFQSALKRFSDDALNGLIKKITNILSSSVTTLIKSMPILLVSCVVTVVATCYISKDFERLIKFVKGFLRYDLYKRIVDIKNIFNECFLKFAIGYLWLFVITFFELLLGFLLLGIDQLLLLAFLVAFLDLLPVIGTGTVLLPWSVVLFFKGNYKLGFGIAILYLVITVVKNFVESKIIGKQIGINPLFTLLFIFLGLRLGGIGGMLIFPIALTVIFTYFRRRYLESD